MGKSIKIKQTYPRINQEAYEFMVKKFREINFAIDLELDELALIGTSPTCSRGCPHCYRQLVLAAPIEGATLIHFIKTTFTSDHQAKIGERNRQWLAWRKDELPNYVKNGGSAGSAHYKMSVR